MKNFWKKFSENAVLFVIILILFVIAIIPELIIWQAADNGEVPWWTIFFFK